MTIQIVSTHDYEAIYIDGKKYDEDHSLDSGIFLNLLREMGADVKDNIYISEKDMLEKFDEQFPDDINDVINEIKY